MTTPNADTLDPNEIRNLPIRRDLPYNGLSKEQVIAIGADPEVVEAGRLETNEYTAQQARDKETQMALAGTEAVATGELTAAQVALALKAGGFHTAHEAFVQNWQAEENAYTAQDAAEAVAFMDSDEYAQHAAAQQFAERAQLEQDVATKKRELQQAQVRDLQKDLAAFVESVPGAHRFAPAVEARLVQNLQGAELPSTPEARAAAIETALRTEAVVSNESQSIREQISSEWRALRKSNGARDGLVTQADVDRARTTYEDARFRELSDARLVNMNALRPGPTAEEQSSALAEKYRAKQEKSDSFHRTVAKIGNGEGHSDRGVTSSAEKRAYKDAYAAAEETAHYGSVRTTENGAQPPVTATGYGPDGTWPDELGPAL